MLVEVTETSNAGCVINTKFFSVDYTDKEKARKVAFRYYFHRREKDFNELINHTNVICDVEIIGEQIQKFLLEMQ